jgi:hypothetical protein
LFQRLALAAASLALSLALAELAARVFLTPPSFHRDPVVLDRELGFRGDPDYRADVDDGVVRHVVEFNQQGMRGRPIPPPGELPSPGERRLLFVGDSYLVGRAVSDAELVTSRVEAALRARAENALVTNLSCVDWGTGQQLLALRSVAAGVDFERIVLFVYPPNDVINNFEELAGCTIVSPGDAIRPYVAPEKGALRVSYPNYARSFARRNLRLFAIAERELFARGYRGEVGSQCRPVGELPREDFELFRAHAPSGVWERAWLRTEALLRAFRDEVRARDARLLAVVVPAVFQVARTAKALRYEVESQLASGAALGARLDWNLPERRLAAFFEQEGIDYRLLLSPLRAATEAGALVFARDEHFSGAGFEVATAAVLDWLDGGAQPVERPSASPVPILPRADAAPARLDFRSEPHVRFLGDGWAAWRPGAGWVVGSRVLVALPDLTGSLALAGHVDAGAPLPLEGQIAVLGRSPQPFRIDTPGDFRLRVAMPPGDASRASASDGYVAVGIQFAAGSAADLLGSVRVTELGIERQVRE